MAKMLHEISDCLIAGGDESSTSQASESEAVVSRMRTVLFILLDDCIDLETGKSNI